MNSNPAETDKDEVKKSVRKHPLPDIKYPFPAKCNPLYECDQKRTWFKWMFELSNMSEKVFNKLTELDLTYAYCYPFCSDLTRYEYLIKQGILLFVWDDHTETAIGDVARDQDKSLKIWGQFEQMIDKFEDKHYVSTVEWKPYVFAFYSVTNEIYRSFNSVQKRRLIKYCRQYMEGNLEETEYLHSGKLFDNIEDFIKIRHKSAAVYNAAQLIEYTDQLVVPEEVWEDKRMQRILELVSFNIFCVNDFLSFDKELNEAGGDLTKTLNIVAVVSIVYKLSINESMEETKTMLEENDNEFIELEQQLTSEPGCLQVTKDFMNSLNYLMGGHLKSSLLMDRYS